MTHADPTLLVNILAPDPFDVAGLLRVAVDAHCARTGATHTTVAVAAGLKPSNLSRALAVGSEARPSTVRAVLRAIGYTATFVPTVTA